MDGGGIPENRLRTTLNGLRTPVAECEGRHDSLWAAVALGQRHPIYSRRHRERACAIVSKLAPDSAHWRGCYRCTPSYSLPTNLPNALRHLDDDQLDRLLAAVIGERQARGGKKLPVSDEPSLKQRVKEVAPPLAPGKLNAVFAISFASGIYCHFSGGRIS